MERKYKFVDKAAMTIEHLMTGKHMKNMTKKTR